MMYRYVSRSFLLTVIALVLLLILVSMMDVGFVSIYNIRNILRWTGLFGLLSLGVAIVIITGGIDLSVGSVVALIGGLCVYNLTVRSFPIPLVIGACLLLAALIGIIHGIFVAVVRVQPFVVTLCGMFVFRGLVRYAMGDITLGYGSRFTELKMLSSGRFPELLFPQGLAPQWISRWSLPMPFIILLVVGVLLHLFLRHTVYGQYLLAMGSNESAVIFTGVSPVAIKITAYAISSVCAGLAGILFSLDLNSVQPSTAGSMYELYAIAGCVVGGLSLKGGEGSIARVILGTGIVRVLYNVTSIAGITTVLESTLIGFVILFAVSVEALSRKRRQMYTTIH